MARLFWLTVMAAFAAALLAGASWAAAFLAVGTLLGSPPPEMGTQTTTFVWRGMARLPGNPRVWCFTFGQPGSQGRPRCESMSARSGESWRLSRPIWRLE